MQHLPGVLTVTLQKIHMQLAAISKRKGSTIMSPKELLYVDDALGHVEYMVKQCQEAANTLTDPTLRAQVQGLVNSNRNLFTKFYNLV